MDVKMSAQVVQQVHSPEPIRRPTNKFKRDLLEKESFVDPAAEMRLLVPEKTVVANLSTQLIFEQSIIEEQKFAADRKAPRKTGAFFYSVYEYLMALFSKVKRRLRQRRAKAALTRKGEETLEQLRYLAMLCDATECRTPEEMLAAESAFGEAYYEIKTLSLNLERMREEEQAHHIERYSRHMAKLLSATQS
jgi:hypothetical protein